MHFTKVTLSYVSWQIIPSQLRFYIHAFTYVATFLFLLSAIL